MIAPEAWEAFGGVAAVVVLLGAVALALQRLGVLPGRAPAKPPAQDPDLGERVRALEAALIQVRLDMAERYVTREDWVSFASRITGMLEDHTRTLARLDERSRKEGGR